MAGPDFLRTLSGIIFRFKERETASTADVEAKFLRLKVYFSGCKSTEIFVERKQHQAHFSESKWKTHFAAKSSPTCVNYTLQQVGRDSGDNNEMVAKLINRSFYMDDFVKSIAPEEAALEVYKRLGTFLATGSFQITKWTRNSENVMKLISPEDRPGSQSKAFEAEPLASSILGLQWSVKSGSLEFWRGMGNEVPAKVTYRNTLTQGSSVWTFGVVFHFHTED